MRTIGEIQAAVREDREGFCLDLSSDELRLCVESQRVMLECLRDAMKGLISVVYGVDCRLGLDGIADLASDVCDQVDDGLGMTPEEWLRDPEDDVQSTFDPKTPG